MSTNLEKAKNARQEVLSLARGFISDWNREFETLKKEIAKNDAESTTELIMKILTIVSVRNTFGNRYDLLVQELNKIGCDLTSQEYDYRIVMEITEGIDKLFEMSNEFNIEISVSGDLKGHLGETEFHMSNESIVMQKSWHYKYDNDSDIQKIQSARKAVAGDLRVRAKEGYDASLKAWEEENKKILEKREAEKCKAQEKINRKKDEKLQQLCNEYTSKKKIIEKEIEKLNKSTEETKKLLEKVGFFDFSKKSELKKIIKCNQESVEKLEQDLISAEEAHENQVYELNNDYDAKIKKEQEKIEEEIIPKFKPRKPESICNQRELTYREVERRVVSLLIEGRFYNLSELKERIPPKYHNYTASVVNNLLKEGLIEENESEYETVYFWTYWEGITPVNVPYDDL